MSKTKVRPRILMHSKRNMNGHICERNVLVPTTKVKDFSVYITSLITTKLMGRSIKVKLNSLLLAMQREGCFNISTKFGCDPLIHATCPWCHRKPIHLPEFRESLRFLQFQCMLMIWAYVAILSYSKVGF